MHEIFISCASGLETLLQKELIALGIPKIRRSFRGVFAPREIRYVYLINYCSRIASRVLWPVARFSCYDQHSLYSEARKVPWHKYLSPEKTFAIDPNVSHPALRNSLFAAQVLKDALCDYFREQTGSRPSVDVQNPNVQLNLFIHQRSATISIDTSGLPLFKRSWRHHPTEASIQETLAAALLDIINFTPHDRLCDPFCGSGTFLIEAALKATNTPPGYLRENWGFVHLPEYNKADWLSLKNSCDSKIKTLPPNILFGADKNPQTIEICQKHLEIAGFSKGITVEAVNVKYYRPPVCPTMVIANPPYGIRLEASAEIYSALGRFIEQQNNPKTYILSSSQEMVEASSCKIKNRTDLVHGGLNVYLFEVERTKSYEPLGLQKAFFS